MVCLHYWYVYVYYILKSHRIILKILDSRARICSASLSLSSLCYVLGAFLAPFRYCLSWTFSGKCFFFFFFERIFYILSPQSLFPSSSAPIPTSPPNPISISISPTPLFCRYAWMNHVKESLSSGLTRSTSLFHFLVHSFYTAHTYTSFQWTSTSGK